MMPHFEALSLVQRQWGMMMSGAGDSRLVGLWEQIGMLHPSLAVPVPWPDGSPNASVREFFRFFEDGTFVFGRFLRDANVSFDESNREFVCDGHTDKILQGRWRLEGTRLLEEFLLPGQPPQIRAVELGELSDDRFVVNEQTPLPDFVLQVVYQKVRSSASGESSATDNCPAQPDPQTDIQEMVATLLDLASRLLARGGFQPIGASISKEGTFAVEDVPPGGSGMELRKRLHRILVRTAKSGRVRAVAICHSLENQMGAFLVVCADHVRAQPVTFLVPLSAMPEGAQVSGEPIVQRAAYTFFKYVEPDSANRLLPGRWLKESGGEDRPNDITYRAGGTCRSAEEQGQWRIEEGDFFSHLVEVSEQGGGRQRVSRIVGLDEHRLELNEVVGGLVAGAVYVRSNVPAAVGTDGGQKRRPWWRFW